MSPSLGTTDRAARERVDAARALLARPILTRAGDPDLLALVRLHAQALRRAFGEYLGYTLVVEAGFARLIKGPLDADAPARPARRGDGQDFTPATYVFLALLCAALLAPDTGEQILISTLIEQVRADAVTLSIDITDQLPDRRRLVNALSLLVSWGVIEETDGTAVGWSERRDETLLTINRALLPHLLARPLLAADIPQDTWAIDEQLAEQPRRSLRRKLVENPLVRREDLTDAEQDVLSRERTEQSRILEEYFGLTLEVRLEGALAYDSSSATTDIAFPGTGSVKQAALLLLAELTDRLEPESGTAAVTDDGRAVPGAAASLTVVDEVLAILTERHAKAWGADAVENPEGFRNSVLNVLNEVSLARTTSDGIIIHPASARYRPLPEASAPTRAARRAVTLVDQAGLFG
ncbi:TIGR02678 family protein [Jatrophihabitans sp.]|uniref:TIGR02678 family protein n=1 Tax=Jatrophihabitans sp. TaxID=1932789 RepID=UPI002B8DF934|nr:TIGR02678 family protein [Jatrophihabitans sp.]